MLAGLVKAPSRWAPTENFDGAKTRMKTVLGAMVDTGVITQAQATRAVRQVHVRPAVPSCRSARTSPTGVFRRPRRCSRTPAARRWCRTTLDPRLQAQAEKILDQAIARDGKVLNVTQGAIVAMRTDGRVVAMVGGRDYKVSQFNRADAQRPPGSAFKLFVYLAALRQGMTPTTPDPRRARRGQRLDAQEPRRQVRRPRGAADHRLRRLVQRGGRAPGPRHRPRSDRPHRTRPALSPTRSRTT